ncbi:putative heavy metal-associated domain, HMA, heavy metal-associated domain superfamily [Helianthus anomalus]
MKRVNYKFCPLCLHQIADAILLAKTLQAVSFTFQNLAHLFFEGEHPLHCDGCKRKVKKILQKVEGVYTINIDPEQSKVTVSGVVDPNTLIKKLAKSRKLAEIWGVASKPNQQINNQMKNMQIDGGIGGRGNNKNRGKKGRNNNNNENQRYQGKGNQQQPPQQGGGPTPQQLQQLQQMKGFQDLKNHPQFKDMKLFAFGGGGGGKNGGQKGGKVVEEDDGSEDNYDDDDFNDDYDDDEFDDLDIGDLGIYRR